MDSFFESPHGKIHRADSKEGQGIDTNHDKEKEEVEESPDKADEQLCIEIQHSLVLPGVFKVQVNAVEDILGKEIDSDCQKDGVLKPKHYLDTGTLVDDADVGILDEEHVHGGEDNEQGENAEVEQDTDRRGPVVHLVLGQPVE